MSTTFSLKLVISLVAAVCVGLLFAATASAHQAASFDPASPSCMGKLTSFHAKDDGGIKKSAGKWAHLGIANALGVDPADGTVKSFQKLSKMWCKSE